jgi:hypothetical protein
LLRVGCDAFWPQEICKMEGAYAAIIKAVEEGTIVGRSNAAGICLNIAHHHTLRSIEMKDAGAIKVGRRACLYGTMHS